MSEVKFRPCPFCGGNDIRWDKHRNHNYRDWQHPSDVPEFSHIYSMCCYGCGATFPNRYRLELLIEAWNRRIEQPTREMLR